MIPINLTTLLLVAFLVYIVQSEVRHYRGARHDQAARHDRGASGAVSVASDSPMSDSLTTLPAPAMVKVAAMVKRVDRGELRREAVATALARDYVVPEFDDEAETFDAEKTAAVRLYE